MSGHSKWNNIKRKKEKTDGARAKIFTKIGRELAVAVKEGGSADPAANSKLKDVIAKAKANNVPNDNIERIIKKASPITATVPQAMSVITLISSAATSAPPVAFPSCSTKRALSCWSVRALTKIPS